MGKFININEARMKMQLQSIFIKWILSIFIYSGMIVHHLTNQLDGMWHGTYYMAGDWELSLGRFMIPVIDKALSGFHFEPFCMIICLLFFVIATEIIMSVFEIEAGSVWNYVFSLLLIANTVVCVSVSYSYTSWIYPLALILAALAMLAVKRAAATKKYYSRWSMLAGLSVALSMGLYQSYVGSVAVMALAYGIYIFYDKKDKKEYLAYWSNAVIGGIFGFLFYAIILRLVLNQKGVALASYQGANNISLATIFGGLGENISDAYAAFFRYMRVDDMHWNYYEQIFSLNICIIIALVLIVLCIHKAIKDKNYILFSAVGLVALLPAAANITFILAPASGYRMQMTVAEIMAILCITMLIYKFADVKEARGKIATLILSLFMLSAVWGSIWQVEIDQEAMRQGLVADAELTDKVMDALVSKNLLDTNRQYALMGSPDKNGLVCLNEAYNYANEYAKTATINWGMYQDNWNYYGYIVHRKFTNLWFVDDNTYTTLMSDEQVAAMPQFPADGSIQEINGIIVVKIS